MRRLRFHVEGCGYGVYDYRVELDWGAIPEDNNGTSIEDFAAIKDVYIGIHDTPYLGYVRVGHFKAPFSLEELTDGNHTTFIERGLPNVFAPSRQYGIAAYNNTCEASVQAEWMWANGETMGVDRDFYGAYVLGSYFLTGENRAYKRGTTYAFDRVTPHTNYWLISGCKGMGAWELTARWSWLDLTEGVDTNTSDDASGVMNNYTVGVNWYWNPYARMMFNYIHSDADYNSATNADSEADIWMARMQFDF
jgi:phosphate-selective porin